MEDEVVGVVEGEEVVGGSVGDGVLVSVDDDVGSSVVVPKECESVVAGTVDVAVMVPIVLVRVSVRVEEMLGVSH